MRTEPRRSRMRAAFDRLRSAGPLGRARDERGFTLLEVIIALAIMLVAFASILSIESSSLTASARAHQMNIVAMLARNKMIETEYGFEGKTFDEQPKAGGGTFASPYQDYRWTTAVKEIKFPNISAGGSKGGGSSGGGGSGGGGGEDNAEQMMRLVTNFLSKSLREVTVTIFWKRGSGEQTFSVSTYWVDLNHEFELSE